MTTPTPSPLHAFIAAPGFEAALAAELAALRIPVDGPRWPAVLSTRATPPLGDPVFALQQIPGATQVQGASVRALAEGAFAAVDAAIDAATTPFTVHACVPDEASYGKIAARATLISEELLALLRERRRRASKRFVSWAEAPSSGDVLVVQLVLVGRTSLLVSAARPRPLPRGGFDLAPWPAGRAEVPEDKRAPSRAYRKLVEGFAWLGAGPEADQTCVDLGGSPGGWSWKALERGAHVTAVDRSPLAPPAAGHPHLQQILGNAFTYEPPAPVDWLLCDVICEPERTFALVERWMSAKLCRALVVTVKFKGEGQYGLLAPARARLERLGWPTLRMKHLTNHHNEVVILARAG